MLHKLKTPFYLTTPAIRVIQRNLLTKYWILWSERQVIADFSEPDEYTQPSSDIWFCWFQEIENAPSLVKHCLRRLEDTFPSKNVHVITLNNYHAYTKLPDYIEEKFAAGKISYAHFSDILRTELLVRHGGMWIDSTVFCGDQQNCRQIAELPFFFYSSVMRNDDSFSGSSWLIVAKRGNPVMALTRDLLWNYWKQHNRLSNYFLFHICFTIACNKFSRYVRQVPVISNVPSHILANYLNNVYDHDQFELIFSQAAFHKLSNKATVDGSSATVASHLFTLSGGSNELH